MLVKPLVSFADQLAVKPLLAAARFVTRNEQDAPVFRIERESSTPDSVRGVKAQLLHVRAPGILERISTRASEFRSKLLEQARQGKNLVLDFLFEGQEFPPRIRPRAVRSISSTIPPRVYPVKSIPNASARSSRYAAAQKFFEAAYLTR